MAGAQRHLFQVNLSSPQHVIAAADVLPLLRRPWLVGATGPEAFDCWGLLVWFYRERYGIALKDYSGRVEEITALAGVMREAAKEIAGGEWVPVDIPQDGDGVALSKATRIHHVGIYLARWRSILHTLPGCGVALQPVASLKANGFSNIQFFRHHERAKGNLC